MKVHIVLHNSDVYDSCHRIVSVHRSDPKARKAMVKHKRKTEREWRKHKLPMKDLRKMHDWCVVMHTVEE